MNLRFFNITSIVLKVWMSLLGAFLMIFLVVHLSINLCLLRSDGGRWFNDAAYFMGTNYVVKVLEVILFAGFIFHILLGIKLQLINWLSRPQRYYVQPRSRTPFLSKYMIYTGGIVLLFLAIHMVNFYFIKLGWVANPLPALEEGHPDFYAIARLLFAQPFYTFIYCVLFIILGFHLNHGFQAAFQSIGLNDKKYTPLIEKAGLIYSILIPAGFIIIPLYIYFIR
jgi:succinate dehydrogenase / fumarate reductase, cytochrome b subunit